MRIKSILTLRLDDQEQAVVVALQNLTREATASKAIMTAVQRYPEEQRRAHELEENLRRARGALVDAQGEIADLKARLNAVRRAIEDSPNTS